MSSSLSSSRVREWLRELRRLTAERSQAEVNFTAEFRSRFDAIDASFSAARLRIDGRRDAERQLVDQESRQARDHILAKAEQELKAAKNTFGTAREEALERFHTAEETTNREFEEARWTLDALLEAATKKAKSVREQARRRAAEQRQAVESIRQETLDQLRQWKLVPPGAGQETAGDEMTKDAFAHADDHIAAARDQLKRLQKLVAPKVLVVDRFLIGAFIAWTAMALSGFIASIGYLGPVIATGFVPFASLALWFGLRARLRAQAMQMTQISFRALAEAERLSEMGLQAAEASYRHDLDEVRQRHRDDRRSAEKNHRKQLAGVLQERDNELGVIESRHAKLTAESSAFRDREIGKIDAENNRRRTNLAAECDHELAAATTQFHHERAGAAQAQTTAFEALTNAWHDGITRLQRELSEIRTLDEGLFPNWSTAAWSGWSPPHDIPGGIRFGQIALDIATLDRGQPSDDRLKPFEPQRFELPALLPFPHRCATLLRAADAGRTAAVQSLQAMMLRFVTALPPGKVRFTIIDPVGRGDNFAAFMHLADYDEQLVGSRIWTETQQIEKRLVDMTEHMENVIQKYLRNQYHSIEEYNQQAGEVAEPYRVLVVANFPTNFSLDAARRLVSIAGSGAGCGVYTLVSVDATQPLPQGFQLADLEHVSENLACHAGRWQWDDADFGAFPLALDAPPPATTIAGIVQTVGEQAKKASRVEVDFDFIAPPPDRWWTGDSRHGVDIPLGRAGATKRQHLRLGQGTAQHVLVAGKTGSGKSTLLHALITNLALTYSPAEVELYLIDFKKGVEFKTYATRELPHARVIAVESEREFGLSVLQKLDAELRRRGDLFRMAGVQDIAAYRQNASCNGSADSRARQQTPRILLIVDEFQEFFVEDDRISQEAALLLDRLVRQGRAFGLHVLLGSQTLGGTYSLARSTIDQMAVRIALQCSEADANLILSKDNNAARLLSRPGEAIYNDANGLLEGNDVFQVVWLSDERREQYLASVQALARTGDWRPPGPAVVFEGNHPAEIAGNHLLRRLIEHDSAVGQMRERVAWLGDALAIKDPTAIAFRQQSGSSLLILGQQAEPARAVLAAAVAALSAQHSWSDILPPGLAPITVLDGSPVDDPHHGFFGKLASALPGRVRIACGREQSGALELLADELGRRLGDPLIPTTPLFLVVYGLHRFRDLRKVDDDYGFGRRENEKPASLAATFAELVREGPALGIHVLTWCDTLANAQKALDRSGLREFAMRVLFQMNVSDSSTLIDTPQASRLGLHRALLACEEMGAPEKFRPYSVPTDEWLFQWGGRLKPAPALSSV